MYNGDKGFIVGWHNAININTTRNFEAAWHDFLIWENMEEVILNDLWAIV